MELAKEHDVRFVTTNICDLIRPNLLIEHAQGPMLAKHEAWCDVMLVQGHVMHDNPEIRVTNKIVIADVYDPVHLEQLEQARDKTRQERRRTVAVASAILNQQLVRADFVICASEKQRDFWLGHLASLGRVNPAVYDEDESLRSLIDVVPFGVPALAPPTAGKSIKGVIPGIGPNDEVLLWGGGIYNWFDPVSLITAMSMLRNRRPRARLLFLGTKHPNPMVPEMSMAVEARRASDHFGLTGSTVFFNEDWVAYDERGNYFAEADIGVSTHLDHIETAYSFRTRILDYIWAGLPIVCTAGDSLTSLIEREGLGLTVPPGDPASIAQAVELLLSDGARRQQMADNARRTAETLRWSKAVLPLLGFCRRPARAADLTDPAYDGLLGRPLQVPAPNWGGPWGDVALIRQYATAGGPRLVASRAWARMSRVARGRQR